MPKINKVVSTVWYDKENYHTLRNVFPESEFVYADFYDKEKLEERGSLLPGKRNRFLYRCGRPEL